MNVRKTELTLSGGREHVCALANIVDMVQRAGSREKREVAPDWPALGLAGHVERGEGGAVTGTAPTAYQIFPSNSRITSTTTMNPTTPLGP